MRSAPAIGFECRPSPRLAWLLRLMLSLAGLALCQAELAWWQRLGLAAFAGALYGRARWRLRRSPLRALAWSAGAWRAILPSGGEVSARLLGWRRFGAYHWLYLELSGAGRHGLLLGPDNLDADSLRLLRMRLSLENAGMDVAPL